jgi:hypothetical protein
MYPPRNEGSAIDSIEHELYDPKKKVTDFDIHEVHTRRPLELPTSWGDDNLIISSVPVERGMSFGMKALLVSLFVLVAAGSFLAWQLISSRNIVSSANIDMTADITPYVEGGEQTPLSFTLNNKNTAPLESASLTLMYKQGSGAQDEQEKVYEKRDLGLIKAGEYKTQDFKVTLFGSESEARDIVLKLEYKVSGSNAVFNKTITQGVTLKTPPITVHIEGPETLSIGQNGEYKFTIKNNSATSSLPSILELTLPNNFTVEDQSSKPFSRTTSWAIESLKPGASKIISVTGSLKGVQGETSTIRAIVGSYGDTKASVGIVYSKEVADVKLRASPLTLAMSLENEIGIRDTVRYGDKAILTINYSNDTNTPLQDARITIRLSGEAALYKLVDPGVGYYDSEAKTITWDKASQPELGTLQPYAHGSMRVIVPTVSKGTNSPILRVTLEGVASSLGQDDIITTQAKEWVAQGSVSLQANTAYQNSPFVNTGPVPPEPNKTTTYTTHIIVSAQNALSAARVSFILPVYVTWRGVSSDQNAITYTPRTRTVTWNIGNVDASKTVTADIGLAVKPSQSHVGTSPPITSGIILDADEQGSGAHIRTTISPITTRITKENWDTDPSFVVDR